MAQLFVTSYGDYNEGNQFEHGYWLNLLEFSDAMECYDFIVKSFEDRGVDFNSDVELMITDYEEFPEELYNESMSFAELEDIYKYLDFDEDDQAKFAYLLYDGQSVEDAFDMYEDVYLYIDDGTGESEEDLFFSYYPDSLEVYRNNPYADFDIEQFIEDNFNSFTHKDVDYFVEYN